MHEHAVICLASKDCMQYEKEITGSQNHLYHDLPDSTSSRFLTISRIFLISKGLYRTP